VHGIEPTHAGNLANERGIKTLIAFFGEEAVKKVVAADGRARIVTATNVFAHIEDIHEIVDCIGELLGEGLAQGRLVFDQQEMFHRIRHLASAKSLT
jgi:hypothetical protein